MQVMQHPLKVRKENLFHSEASKYYMKKIDKVIHPFNQFSFYADRNGLSTYAFYEADIADHSFLFSQYIVCLFILWS